MWIKTKRWGLSINADQAELGLFSFPTRRSSDLPNAILLGGGTDLGLRVSKDREALPAVIALEAVEELRHVTISDDAIEIISEEHTSELQSHVNLVCLLVLD